MRSRSSCTACCLRCRIFAGHGLVGQPGQAAAHPARLVGVLGLGFTGYYLASFLDFAGLAYISASLERLILYLNPTLVLLLGLVLYKRHISRRQALGMAISYCGVILVFGHEINFAGADAALGALLVFGSAVSYAIYLSFSGELVQRLGSLRLVGPGQHGGLRAVHRPVCAAAAHAGRAGGARGDLAVGAERHRCARSRRS